MPEPSLQHQFDRCRPWIEAALEYSSGTHTGDDVLGAIKAGRMQFWPAPRAAVVTEILDFPRKRLLHVFLAGGEMASVIEMLPSVEEFARANRCDGLTIAGRPGWQRIMKRHGFEPAFTALAKEF